MKLLNTLLHLYPAHWRARYEDEFIALLEQHPISLVDIGDIALGALDAHLKPQVASAHPAGERRPLVNRASFIKWSGLAGMLGSLIALSGLVAMGFASDSEYPYTYDAFDAAAGLLFFVGVLLTLVFAAGFAVAHARPLGVAGQLGLLITFVSLLSTLVGTAGFLTEVTSGRESSWWNFFMVGLAGTLLGMSVSCLAGAIQKVLPAAPSLLTLAGGFGAITVLIVSMGIIPGVTYDQIASALLIAFVSCLSLFNLGLFLLAYDLWGKRQAVAPYIEPAALG